LELPRKQAEMSWIPELEFGLWNAWILMLYYPLHPIIMILVDKVAGTGDMLKKMGDVPYEGGEKRAFLATIILSFVMFISSLFLPLKPGTIWLTTGLLIYLVGLAMFMIAIVNIATTPLGHPFVDGIYRYSRHPMIFFSFITFLGISLATMSWVFLLLSIVVMVLQAFQAIAEERGCIELYGNRYQEYFDRTPMWIGIPKSS
jgi:protein-S-isoprenylcysteine O-methyltransferase Ste14